MYRKENREGKCVYVFDGDLEQFLLQKGVEAEHIEKMKNKMLQHNKNEYYSSKHDEKENMLVPLVKVIGTSRGTIGKSVFENVRTMRDGEREPSRFKNCFSFFIDKTLEELRDSYKTICPVEMNYYEDDDEYYLTIDGNHRTLTAMLVGAEYIKANVTPMYCDFEKREKCLAVDKFYKDFSIIQINYTYVGVEIVFRDNDNYYVVNGFQGRRDENCYEYISKLSDEIKADMKLVKICKNLPKIIVTILDMLSNNKRIRQYIDKSRYVHSDKKVDIYKF